MARDVDVEEMEKMKIGHTLSQLIRRVGIGNSRGIYLKQF